MEHGATVTMIAACTGGARRRRRGPLETIKTTDSSLGLVDTLGWMTIYPAAAANRLFA